jgi:hypothetical protein
MPFRLRTRRRRSPDGIASDSLGEITKLTAANRVERDSELERQLIRLRLAALDQIDLSNAPPRWPPTVPDLFPDAGWPPEVPAVELTLEKLQSGIFRHGCLLVRGLIDPSRVDQLIHDVDRTFDGFHAWYEAYQRREPTPETPWYVPHDQVPDHHRVWCLDAGGVLAVESPRGLFDIVEAFEDAGLAPILTEFLGGRPALLARKWHLRRVPAGITADWHQDGAFMGSGIRTVNVWVALSPCGEGHDAPGLNIVARRLEEVVETGTDGARLNWSVGPGMAERVANGRIVSPTFEPGDALLFDHLLLHRTDQRPGTVRDRYAVEAWFAAPSNYPPEQMPAVF